MSAEFHDGLVSAGDAGAIVPIRLVAEAGLEAVLADPRVAALAAQSDFKAQAGRLLLVQGAAGALEAVLLGVGKGGDPMVARGLPTRLPAGDYEIVEDAGLRGDLLALAWAFGGRVFDRYKADVRAKADRRPRLVVREGLEAIRSTAHACAPIRPGNMGSRLSTVHSMARRERRRSTSVLAML